MLKTCLILETKQLNLCAERLKTLRKYFLPSPFSSKSIPFHPTKNDWQIIRKYVPTILLCITNRCNTFCKICFTSSAPFDYSKELSKREIVAILKRIGKRKRVVLMGGEPTVREDLFEIVKLVKKSGNRPELYTNGLKLSSLGYVRRLKRAGVRRIYFSFDGFRKEIYDKMNGSGEVLLLKLLALRNLETVGIDVIISARVVRGVNGDQIRGLIELCVASAKRREYVKGVYFYGATRYGRFALEGSGISTSELVGMVERATDRQVDLDYLIEIKRLALNLFKAFSRFGLHFTFGSGGLVGLYRAGSIKKLLPTDFVRKINAYFERGKPLTAIYKSLKNAEVRKVLARLILGKDLIGAVTRAGTFVIGIGNVNTPLNHRPYHFDSVGFEKGEGTGLPLVKVASYTVPDEPAI